MMRKVIFAVFAFCCTGLYAQEVGSIVDGQAIFIYNFTRLVAWPESRNINDFTIGVLGSSEAFAAIKKYTKQKRVGGKAIEVKRFTKASEIDNTCHILLVTSSAVNEIDRVAEMAKTGNILLITEKKGMIEKGAAISFLLIDGKIKYEIKTDNIIGCQLKYASQLEALAYKRH